eukprot:CAMPEP_0185263836 /NCGR_PEP_ID=MMETSP1359-20130426/16900_1 /TAXON_ID=552665 /ORGANISM="Bigelowiella longifila, Strain CCMP242" /LENGTH=271 /DNA_ID=CAMNT_0027851687 /DNA_START=64 /DNA_END=879 /DNA_ORIENTATION=+
MGDEIHTSKNLDKETWSEDYKFDLSSSIGKNTTKTLAGEESNVNTPKSYATGTTSYCDSTQTEKDAMSENDGFKAVSPDRIDVMENHGDMELDENMVPFMTPSEKSADLLTKVVMKANETGNLVLYQGYLERACYEESSSLRKPLKWKEEFFILHQYVLFHGTSKKGVLQQAIDGIFTKANILPLSNIASFERDKKRRGVFHMHLRSKDGKTLHLMCRSTDGGDINPWITSLRNSKSSFSKIVSDFARQNIQRRSTARARQNLAAAINGTA